MFGMCMRGKKKNVCGCVPLNVAGLGISVMLIVLNGATFLEQLKGVLHAEKKEASQIISLIFCALPLLCAFLSILGILLKKASLVGLAVSCIMPSVMLVIVSIITLWISICQDSSSTSGTGAAVSYKFLNWVHVEGSNGKYVRGGIITAIAVVVIALLCYVGDIFKSIASMLSRRENPWLAHQPPKNKNLQHASPSADSAV